MSESGLTIGDRMPGARLRATDGNDYELEEEGAAATVIYWTCNHCPYALAWQDRLHEVAREYLERGVRVLAVNSNSAETHPADSFDAMRERVDREGGWPTPFLHDESQQVAGSFGALTTPDVFVFDGQLELRYRGAPDGDYDDPALKADWLRAALDAIIEGRDPEPAETQPVGCGIKWR